MGSGEHTLETVAPAEAIWRRWTQVERWPEDDPSVLSAHLDGPLALGATGSVQPRRSRSSRLTVTALEPLRRCTTAAPLPVGRLNFEHTLEPMADGVRCTHRVRLPGPLAPLFGRLIGRQLVAGLPQVMSNVARHRLRVR